MRNLFNSVRRPAVRYNKFDLSYTNSLTADYGLIYPCMVKEVHAGEVMRDFTENFIRTQPLTAPAFIRADASIHYFFVPYRLCYEDWSKFIVRGKDGDTDYDKPYLTPAAYISDIGESYAAWKHGSLMDYLNFPTLEPDYFGLPNTTAKLDMIPFNAYSLIYNEYYRDENLVPEVFIWKYSGYSQNLSAWQDYCLELAQDWLDDPTSEASVALSHRLSWPMYLRSRAWRKDYFTSALPFVQKGTQISLAGAVQGQPGQYGVVNEWWSSLPLSDNTSFVQSRKLPDQTDANRVQLFMSRYTASYDGDNVAGHRHTAADATNYVLNSVTPLSGLQSSVMTISDLRVGLALQQWFELNARTGSDRYFEYLLGHFGVRDRDARLQRPEYLGGFTHSIQVSEVEQTSSTNEVTPQGNLAGKGLGFSRSHPVRYRFPEPGLLMAMLSIRPQSVYYQGLPRMYQRWDCFDYYDPLFDHLSEQPIWQSELKFDWSFVPQSEDDAVFGYTPRFSELRTSLSECHGDFRKSLKYWISPRSIPDDPQLDKDFIEVQGYAQSLYDAFAYVGAGNKPSSHFIVHMRHDLSILRPMSKYATPKL